MKSPTPGAVVVQNIGLNARPILGHFAVLMAPLVLFVTLYRVFGLVVVLLSTSIWAWTVRSLCATGGSQRAAWLSAGVLLSAAAGLFCYYGHVLPVHALNAGRMHLNVDPQQPAIAFADASIIRFADRALVDDTKAAGLAVLESGADVFCAAPILDAASNGRVNFWAVGLNCCGRRTTEFKCNQDGIKGGPVVPNIQEMDLLWDSVGKHLAPSWVRRDLFIRAADQAAAMYGLASSESPLFVQWSAADADELIRDHRAQSFQFLVLVAALAFALAAAIGISGTNSHVEELFAEHLSRRGVDQQASGIGGPAGPAQVAQEQQRQLASEDPAAQWQKPTGLYGQLVGLVFPWLAFVICVLGVSWASCWHHGRAVLLFLATALLAAAATLSMTRRTFSSGVLVLTATAAGFYIGNWNYHHYTSQTCAAATHRTYNNVRADANAGEYADAGELYFDISAGLSTEHSVGFLFEGVQHCVAPVVPKACAITSPSGGTGSAAAAAAAIEVFAATNSGRSTAHAGKAAPANCESLAHVDFWAVGKECCDPKGGFECFPDGQIYAGAGLVSVSSQEGDDDEEFAGYLLALRSASELYGLPRSTKPLLVTWGRDPEAIRQAWAQRSVEVIAFSSLAAFVVLFLITNGGPLISGTSTACSGLIGETRHVRKDHRSSAPEEVHRPTEGQFREELPSLRAGYRGEEPSLLPMRQAGQGPGNPFHLASGGNDRGSSAYFQTTPVTGNGHADPWSPPIAAPTSDSRTRFRKSSPIQ